MQIYICPWCGRREECADYCSPAMHQCNNIHTPYGYFTSCYASSINLTEIQKLIYEKHNIRWDGNG